MEGLKYLLDEIEARRNLLHTFIKGMQTPSEFMLFAGGVPDFVKDGELIYRPNMDSEPYKNLTYANFIAMHGIRFRDLREWSSLSIPLNPANAPPREYEINEVLSYELGGGYCKGNFLMELCSPSFQKPDRKLGIYIEHRNTPIQMNPLKTIVDVNALWRLMGKEVPAYPEYKNYEIRTPSVDRYKNWKKDARRAKPRSNPEEIEAKCGGEAIWIEEGKVYTAPVIVIDEETPSNRIWTQLLVYAWGSDYFSTVSSQEKLKKELIKYWQSDKKSREGQDIQPTHEKEQVMNDMLLHFRKHVLSPFVPGSSGQYIRKLLKDYAKKAKDKVNGDMQDQGKSVELGKSIDEDEYLVTANKKDSNSESAESQEKSFMRQSMFRYRSDSVPYVALETGVSESTIYRFIRNGKIERDINPEGFISLNDKAVSKIKQFAEQTKRCTYIYVLASTKGKSHAATKKWLQRHKHLSNEEMNLKLGEWLMIDGKR